MFGTQSDVFSMNQQSSQQKFTKINNHSHQNLNTKSIDQHYIQKKKMKQLNSQIKRNEVDKIIEIETVRKTESDRKNNDGVLNKQLHNYLNTQRKRYDEVRKIQKQREDEMIQLKRELDQLIRHENGMQHEIGDCHQKVNRLQQQLKFQKQQIDQQNYNKFQLMYLLRRYKYDLIQYEKRSQRLETEKRKEEQQLKIHKNEAVDQQKMSIQSQNVLKQILEKISSNHENRVDQMEVLMDQIDFMNELEEKQKQQCQKQEEVRERAVMDIKYSNEKRWRELYLVQRLYSAILKIRQSKLMEYYRNVENGYQKIIRETGIADSYEILKKFINNEDSYVGLTKQISRLDEKVQDLEREKQELEKVMAQAKGRCNGGDDRNQEKRQQQEYDLQMGDVNKQLSVIYDKERIIQIICQKINEFNRRTNNKLEKINKTVQQSDETIEQFKLNMECLQTVLQDSSQFNNGDKQKIDRINKTIMDTTMDQSAFQHRNQRVLFTDPRNVETIEISDEEKLNDFEMNEKNYVQQMRSQTKQQLQVRYNQYKKMNRDKEQ